MAPSAPHPRNGQIQAGAGIGGDVAASADRQCRLPASARRCQRLTVLTLDKVILNSIGESARRPAVSNGTVQTLPASY